MFPTYATMNVFVCVCVCVSSVHPLHVTVRCPIIEWVSSLNLSFAAFELFDMRNSARDVCTKTNLVELKSPITYHHRSTHTHTAHHALTHSAEHFIHSVPASATLHVHSVRSSSSTCCHLTQMTRWNWIAMQCSNLRVSIGQLDADVEMRLHSEHQKHTHKSDPVINELYANSNLERRRRKGVCCTVYCVLPRQNQME